MGVRSSPKLKFTKTTTAIKSWGKEMCKFQLNFWKVIFFVSGRTSVCKIKKGHDDLKKTQDTLAWDKMLSFLPIPQFWQYSCFIWFSGTSIKYLEYFLLHGGRLFFNAYSGSHGNLEKISFYFIWFYLYWQSKHIF